MDLTAKWIWSAQDDYLAYNQTIIAKREVVLSPIKSAVIRITADSSYRLSINGRWVNDGPCRSWPEHYQYDEIDVTSYLVPGANQLHAICRYYGVGTFHQLPRHPGLLAQLDVNLLDGTSVRIVTDDQWSVAQAPMWQQNTPKVSIQMEPMEVYDARLESTLHFTKARVLFDTYEGPWSDLHPRDVALLTRKPFSFLRYVGASIVERSTTLRFTVPTARLVHPNAVEANHSTSQGCAIATVVSTDCEREVSFVTDGFVVAVNGQTNQKRTFSLHPGRNLVIAAVSDMGSHRKEQYLGIIDPSGLAFKNPLEADHENPWCFIPFPDDCQYVGDDMVFWPEQYPAQQQATRSRFEQYRHRILSIGDVPTFIAEFGEQAVCLPSETMFVVDPHREFLERRVIGKSDDLVERASALMHDNAEYTVVHPCSHGDVELVYDLGEQNCGYIAFDLIAESGTILDVFGIEYLTPDGRLQHTRGNRNGFRYITKSGVNQFTSIKRRSGRFFYITLRNQSAPVRIRNIQLIESTYPVDYKGSFSCSDMRLDRIWEISARTLKLCMEDTFTDCPLYEQTLWVGDARNESLFDMAVFGATDIVRRCIELAGQSLERYPIVGCQVPSSWDCLLPAWSFLWGISVWDYYFYSGDEPFLRRVWPWVVSNLRGAEKHTTKDGLFSGPFWNMFDWSGIDDRHETVLHCSMLLVGAIDAARRCADVLCDDAVADWLAEFRSRLVTGIDRMWDHGKGSYVDSVHRDGSMSPSVSQHTNVLAVLYDIVRDDYRSAAIRNIVDPPEHMVRIGSPFATLYVYEALEKLGRQDCIIESIYRDYVPMLEAGATTVWEVFPSGTGRPKDFPTRSHAHAWSSAPVYYLTRVVLGIRQTGVGGSAYDISPYIGQLAHAKGSVATPRGPLHVEWRRTDGGLDIHVSPPNGVAWRFVPNPSHDGLQVRINGEMHPSLN